MTPTDSQPRLAGLLTANVALVVDRLPLPFPPWARRVVARAIAVAWDELSTQALDADLSVGSMKETEITTALQMILNDMRQSPRESCPAFSGQAFQHVVRDASEVSFDARSIEKAPDLAFRTAAMSPGAAGGPEPTLLAEAKIVTPSPRHRVGYCTNGIMRFVKGEYAWYMDCGLMVGYVRDGASGLLASFLAVGDRYNTESAPSDGTAEACLQGRRVYFSVHRREWMHLGGSAPGDISISHLWLD